MKPLKFINTLNETEPELARREYITRNVLFFTFCVTFSFTLISFILYLFGKMPPDTLIIYSVVSITIVVSMFLAEKGYWRVVGIIPPILMYFPAVNANYIGGIDAPGNFMYALLIIFVAIIYGYRKMWIALGICVATYLCLAWMISIGYIKPFRAGEVVFINRVVLTSSFLVGIALMIWILGRSYRSEIDVRIKAEELLERKNKELGTLNEKLRTSETKYQFLAESMADVVFMLDMNLATTYVSPSIEKMLGFTQEERINQKVDQQLTPKSQELILEVLLAELAREKEKGIDPDRSVTLELEYYHKDGSIKYLVTYLRGIRNSEGKLTGIYGSHHDITERNQAGAALRESEERYRTLVENASDCIFRTDNTGHFNFVNPAALSITGYKEEEVIGIEYPALIRSDMRDEAIKFFGRQFVKGINNTYSEYPVIKKDGHEIWLGQNTQLIVEDGSVKGFQSVARDITERKRAQEALHYAEESYRNIFMNSQIGLYRTDMKTGIMIEANDKLAQVIGYKNREDLLSSNFNIAERYVDPEARKEILALIGEHGQINNYEALFRINNGEIRWVRFSVKLVPAKSWLEGVSEDITKEKEASETIKKSEERYRLLVENVNEAIVVLQDGVIKFVNSRAVESLGYSEQELLSSHIFKLIHPEDREAATERYLQKISGYTTASRHTYRSIHKSGQTLWIEISSVLIDWEGQPATLNLITDMTDRVRAEEEKRILEERLQQADKMEAIGTLAGGIAHDFNNLLTGIQGYASMTLMNLKDNDPNYERLQRIQEQVKSGGNLTQQLLGFARGGRYEIKPSDMNEIIEKTSSMFGRTKKEISIQRKPGKDLWVVEVDRGQMEQVFMNLYVNAWQAMPGGGDIYLETQNAFLNDEQISPYFMKPGKYVKIAVTDTGTGMDEKTQEKIFEPFFTTKAMGRGTGLGLATVYGIIKGHCGMINVYSEIGHGTTFTIYLPASEKQLVQEDAPIDEIVPGTETILLIDDEKTVMEVNKELLETMGYTVYAAGSGQEGLAVYMEKKDKIDLVILDMIMPGISGGVTFDRLRQINPAVKVLLSSGYSLNGKAQEIMDRGCNGFLQKPFIPEELSGKVREMFG